MISKMREDRNILEVEREPEVRACYEIHKRLGIELYGSSLKLLENNLFSLCDQYVIRKCRFSYNFVNINCNRPMFVIPLSTDQANDFKSMMQIFTYN